MSCNVSFPSLLFLSLFLLVFTSLANAKGHNFSSSSSSSMPSKFSYVPQDNLLLSCGSSQPVKLDDGRTFESDSQSSRFLSTEEDVQIVGSISTNLSSSSSLPSALPLYQSARIFTDKSTYTFYINDPGRHWLRLYFYPLPHPTYNLTDMTFTVTTDFVVLLHDFSLKDNTTFVFKEYLLNLKTGKFSLHFTPKKNSFAFINAIEVVSAPDALIPTNASALSPVGNFDDLSNSALEISYRLNVGGPLVTPANDTLSRTWQPDSQFMAFPQGAQNVSVEPEIIKYPDNNVSTLIAPRWIYASADEMVDSNVTDPNFNLTWEMSVDPNFSYFIRLHFCDMVSKSLNDLYFNVYINGLMGISALDLSTINNGVLAVAYFKDFVLDASLATNGSIMVQVGPSSNGISSFPNAILNGLEVLKLNNSVGSLNGTSTVDKRPQGWEEENRSSSWLLPLHSGHAYKLSSKSSLRRSSLFGSCKSKSSYSSFMSSALGFGRFFTFKELEEATKNWDEKAVIGMGGFGKVYIGVLEDGTKLAIKRGNPSSQQGINEFHTEIQMLSKLRHRHLVSLIGYCDDGNEMILVYEYMANGPLRDHLYGSNLSPLTWKRRLEICIEKCLAEYGVDRPSMGDVLWNLECALQLQEASSLSDNSDASSSFIALEKPSEKAPSLSSPVASSEDSLVSVGSPMFSQIGNFQG
ncbi:Malectin-like domain, partial [Dillenia turbinata]